MSVRAILTWPDDRLRMPCAEVGDAVAVRDLAQDLFDTMYAAYGRGLAAPQVGISVRLFVMDPTWKEGERQPWVCIDPVIEALGEDRARGTEACLSIPGVDAPVERAKRIRMTYTDLDGARRSVELDGFAAICAQHETDHLDGRLIFDHLDDTARADFLARYEAA